MPLSALRKSYSDLEDSAREVLRAAQDMPPGPALLDARKIMAQAIARAIALREQLLIAPLRASPDPQHRAWASRLTEQAMQSRLRSIENNSKWTVRAIAADPEGFRVTAAGTLHDLQLRIADEVANVHPLVLAARAAAVSPPK
jgi:hypothetical protein